MELEGGDHREVAGIGGEGGDAAGKRYGHMGPGGTAVAGGVERAVDGEVEDLGGGGGEEDGALGKARRKGEGAEGTAEIVGKGEGGAAAIVGF